MKSDWLYWSVSNLLDSFVWRGELMGADNLPDGEAVIYVSNHVFALGALPVTSSLLREYMEPRSP